MKTEYYGVGTHGLKYRVQINSLGRNYYVGLFGDIKEAAEAYDNAAYYISQIDKTNRVLNFPGPYAPEKDISPSMLESTRKIVSKVNSTLDYSAALAEANPLTSQKKFSTEIVESFTRLVDAFESTQKILRHAGLGTLKISALQRAWLADCEYRFHSDFNTITWEEWQKGVRTK